MNKERIKYTISALSFFLLTFCFQNFTGAATSPATNGSSSDPGSVPIPGSNGDFSSVPDYDFNIANDTKVTKTFLPGELELVSGEAINIGSSLQLKLELDGRLRLLRKGVVLSNITDRRLIINPDGSYPPAGFQFDSSGNFIIRNNMTNTKLSGTNLTNLHEPILIVSNKAPFFMIRDRSGILFSKGNQIESIRLLPGQNMILPSISAVISLTTTGDITFKKSITSELLWHSGTSFADNSFYLEIKKGNIRIRHSKNNQVRWRLKDENGSLDNTWVSFNQDRPYIRMIDPQRNTVKWATEMRPFQCQSKTPGSLSCLHVDMPKYSQGAPELLNYVKYSINKLDHINWSYKQEILNLAADPGWCVPTAMGVLAKTYAIERGNYFNDYSFGSITNNFLDSKDSSKIIYRMMQAASTQIAKGFTSFYNILGGLLDSIPTDYITAGTSTSKYEFFGPNQYALADEQQYIKKMPMGIVGVSCVNQRHIYAHALVINGREGDYLKVFDPWGSVMNMKNNNGSLALTDGSSKNNFAGIDCNSNVHIETMINIKNHVYIKTN